MGKNIENCKTTTSGRANILREKATVYIFFGYCPFSPGKVAYNHVKLFRICWKILPIHQDFIHWIQHRCWTWGSNRLQRTIQRTTQRTIPKIFVLGETQQGINGTIPIRIDDGVGDVRAVRPSIALTFRVGNGLFKQGRMPKNSCGNCFETTDMLGQQTCYSKMGGSCGAVDTGCLKILENSSLWGISQSI